MVENQETLFPSQDTLFPSHVFQRWTNKETLCPSNIFRRWKTRKHCILALFSEGGETREHRSLAMFPMGGQTRKLIMFSDSGQTRKHSFLAHCFLATHFEVGKPLFPSHVSRQGNEQTRRLCFLTVFPEGEQSRNQYEICLFSPDIELINLNSAYMN